MVVKSYPVVVTAVNVPGHAEVSNLNQQAIAHQTITGCKISVDKVLGAQVDHARGNLSGDVQHLGKAQLSVRLQWLAIYQDHGVWAVGSGLQKKNNTH